MTQSPNIELNTSYIGNFYYNDQLLRFKSCKQIKEINIHKAYSYNEKHKWFMWSVIINNITMKMFYDNNEYTFYRLNNKTNKYYYWMTANTLTKNIKNIYYTPSSVPKNILISNELVVNNDYIICNENIKNSDIVISNKPIENEIEYNKNEYSDSDYDYSDYSDTLFNIDSHPNVYIELEDNDVAISQTPISHPISTKKDSLD